VRFDIVAREGQGLAPSNNNDRDLAISPDGTHLVYVAGALGATQLMVRAIDQLEPTLLRDTAGARSPFVSPDSRWVGFFTQGELKKVAMTGGPSIALCKIVGAPRGASWSPDGTIVFALSRADNGLWIVPEGGGEPKALTKPDPKQGETDHLAPSMLPGGRAVLFTILSGGGSNSQVAVLDLKTGARKTLVRGGGFAEYVDSGHLVYAAAGTLRAVRFDLARLEVTSDAVPVLEQVLTKSSTGAAEFSVSRQGTLAYVPGGTNALADPSCG
jgi:serine/threonine-protein kinase